MIGVSLEVAQLIFTDLSFAGDSVVLPHQAAWASAAHFNDRNRVAAAKLARARPVFAAHLSDFATTPSKTSR